MTMSHETGLDDREPKFHATPQPALPDKNYHGGPFASRLNGPV
jgi:hypothetical protein